MEIELNGLTKRKIEIEAAQDVASIMALLKKTSVIDYPDVISDYVRELSEKLRSEKEFEVQKIKLLGDLKDD